MRSKPLHQCPYLSNARMVITNSVSYHHHITCGHVNMTQTKLNDLCCVCCPMIHHPPGSPNRSLTVFLSHFHSLFNQTPEPVVDVFKFQISWSFTIWSQTTSQNHVNILLSHLQATEDHASWDDVDLLTRKISWTPYSSLYHKNCK